MKSVTRVSFLAGLLIGVGASFADVPQSICVQGYLEDLAGQQVDAQVTFGVCIYDALTGGNQVWPTVSPYQGLRATNEEARSRGFFPSRAPQAPLLAKEGVGGGDRVLHLSRSERLGTDSTPAPCASITTIVSDGLFTICPGQPNDPPITPDVFGVIGSGPQPRWIEISTGGQAMQPRIELHTAPYASRVGLVDNPELTDNVALGSSTPGNPGSLTTFDGNGNQTIQLHGTTGSASFAGNVGIGTASPTAQLDVNGAMRTTTIEIMGGEPPSPSAVAWGQPNCGKLNPPFDTMIISLGNDFSMTIRSDGTLDGWGCNLYGALDFPEGEFTAIDAGDYHAIAIRSDGTLTGWGYEAFGQTNVPGGTFAAISAGGLHSLGIRSDGTLVGWGDNSCGQSNVPSGTFIAVSAGSAHSLAIRSDGTLAGWGCNSNGEASVPSGTFTAISAGDDFSLAIRSDGTLAAWGTNSNGETDVPAGTFLAAAAGQNRFAVAIRSDGTLVGWGYDGYDVLDVPSGTFSSVAVGQTHGLAIRSNSIIPNQALRLHSDSAFKPGSNTWTIWSDRRLKKDIEPLSGALDRMLQLHGVTFNWIDLAYPSEPRTPVLDAKCQGSARAAKAPLLCKEGVGGGGESAANRPHPNSPW